jgi:NAD-dependent deacetylase
MANLDAARTLAVRDLASRIRGARRLTIMTGAGVSAASGVPTFRGPQGLWRQFRPEDLATPEAFARDPQTVWEWYAWRREQIAACQPNAAHHAIANLANGVRPRNDPSLGSDPGISTLKVAVITQNVDDLHLRAGTPRLIRLHGSIWELSCAARCAAGSRPWRDERVPLSPCPPRCPHCGALARPAVVWFGEPLDQGILNAALQATACDVFLTVGTSSVVYPAAGLVHEAQRRGAFTAEINLEDTPASSVVNMTLHGSADVVFTALDGLLR